eukprot:g11092.t1
MDDEEVNADAIGLNRLAAIDPEFVSFLQVSKWRMVSTGIGGDVGGQANVYGETATEDPNFPLRRGGPRSHQAEGREHAPRASVWGSRRRRSNGPSMTKNRPHDSEDGGDSGSEGKNSDGEDGVAAPRRNTKARGGRGGKAKALHIAASAATFCGDISASDLVEELGAWSDDEWPD